MKKVYVAVIITLCISQVNGQRRMRQGTPSKPQAIALSQVHNMVKKPSRFNCCELYRSQKSTSIKK